MQLCACSPASLRDSSNESGATDAVGLSMNMSEMDDTEMRGKKKRGRPGKQALVCVFVWSARFAIGFAVCLCCASVCLHLPDARCIEWGNKSLEIVSLYQCWCTFLSSASLFSRCSRPTRSLESRRRIRPWASPEVGAKPTASLSTTGTVETPSLCLKWSSWARVPCRCVNYESVGGALSEVFGSGHRLRLWEAASADYDAIQPPPIRKLYKNKLDWLRHV